jgi:uncharacterized protein YdeI (YjbR/CyaY-like superfamily)
MVAREYLPDELPVRDFKTQAAWRTWLDKNHAKSPGVWIRFAKKASGKRSVTYQEAVEVSLCYGWIDGKVRTVDEDHYIQRFTPRRAQSRWSKINRGKAEALIAAGEMKPAGMQAVDEAKGDGRWAAAYASPAVIEVPADLERELKRTKTEAFFEGLNKTNRYAVLYQIEEAKRPETRARRIVRFVEMFQDGRKPYD